MITSGHAARDSAETQFTNLCWQRLAVQRCQSHWECPQETKANQAEQGQETPGCGTEASSERDTVRNEPRTNFGDKDQDMGQGKQHS